MEIGFWGFHAIVNHKLIFELLNNHYDEVIPFSN
jgi:hypothetical protein